MFSRFFILLLASLLLSSCHVGRFFYWNYSDINDHKKFDKLQIEAPAKAFQFKVASSAPVSVIPASLTHKGKEYSWEEALEEWNTVAFLIIRNDTIIYEKYFDGYNQSDIVPSFSVSKSFVSALVGIAIDEGHLSSVNEPITTYLPELRDKEGFDKITIEHLLNMRSGIEFSESYGSPFADVAKLYYGTDIRKYVRKLEIEKEPGQEFDYISMNTQLLGMVLENATGKSLAQYLEEKIWLPLGMEYDASWSVDSEKNKVVKAYCCLNARARDYAKFGRLYMNNGRYEGKQIVPEKWVRRSTVFDSALNDLSYKYQWWHLSKYDLLTDSSDLSVPHVVETVPIKDSTGTVKAILTDLPDYYAQGHLGQYIYVNPESNMVMIRLGKSKKGINWPKLMQQIATKK